MKKLGLSVLSLAGILALAGCGETVVYQPVKVEEHLTPTMIYADEPGFVLFTGETAQIHMNIRPLVASDAVLVYESSDKKVATVSDTGLITAVGGGSADITISAKEDPSVFETVTVGVETNIITADPKDTDAIKAQRKDLNDHLVKQRTVQREKYGTSDDLDKVQIFNGYVDYTTRDGEHFASESIRQDFTISRSNGFFHFNILDKDTRSPGGDASLDAFGYYFFCNEDFDAHVYKHSDSARRRCKVNAQDYIGKVDRTEVVCLMLDQFFTSGRKVFTNQPTNALESSAISGGSAANKGGYSGDGLTSGGYFKFGSPGTQKVKADEEDDLNIPTGIVLTFKTDSGYHWSNGRIDASYTCQTMEYDLDGHHYVNTSTAYTRVLIEEEVDIVYPDRDSYQSVATIFDL